MTFQKCSSGEPNDEIPQVEPQGQRRSFSTVALAGQADVDCYAFRVAKGESLQFDFKAVSLGSPLNAVLVLLDSTGKELSPFRGRSIFRFRSTTSVLEKRECIFGAGGRAIRVARLRCLCPTGLRVAPPPLPDFKLRLVTDAVVGQSGRRNQGQAAARSHWCIGRNRCSSNSRICRRVFRVGRKIRSSLENAARD